MNYWNKICLFAPTFFLTALFSTAQTANTTKPLLSILPTSRQFFSLPVIGKPVESPSTPSTIIAQNYYTQHIGWVCKKEYALEKITKIPLRIRLGSLQQCNYLEGKK